VSDSEPSALRARIAEHLAGFERHSVAADGRLPAAVAIAVVAPARVEPGVLMTVRAGHLRTHRGQFALPGGRLEAGETAPAAARRELAEELGLQVGPDDTLGLLDDFPTRSGYVITPVVLWAGTIAALEPDPQEVAEVHEVALRELDRPDVPRFEPGEDAGRPLIAYPLLGTFVYAPTAAILFQFREVALRGETTRVAHLEQPRFAWR
jgi:8-oxo-dGTP pyrophosphatase MutT (NUDIX family)